MSKIKKPVIIIGCPRSGTTLLFTILSQSKELYSLYRESWNVFWGAYQKDLLDKYADSDLLRAEDLSDKCQKFLLDRFHEYTVNNEAMTTVMARCFRIKPISSVLPIINPFVYPLKAANAIYKETTMPDGYRIVEKTPRNCFRVPFMNKLFPDAKFVFISREGKTNVSSLIEGWKRNASQLIYNRFPKLNQEFKFSNFNFKKWEYVLPPGWQDFNGHSLEETCAHQWIQSNKYALDALEELEQDRVIKIKYEDLVCKPAETIKAISSFIEVPFEGSIKEYAENPPVVSTPQKDKPCEDKWMRNKEAIERIEPMLEPMLDRLGYKSKVTA